MSVWRDVKNLFAGTMLDVKGQPDARQPWPAYDWRDWFWLFMIFALGAAWGVWFLDRREEFRQALLLFEEPWIAEHLARGHGFRSPFDLAPTAPLSSWSPPVYPAIIALVFQVLGIQSLWSSVVLHQLNAFLYGLVGAGLFTLGRMLYSRLAGLCVAGLFFMHPMFLNLVARVWDHYLALAAFVWLLVAALWIAQRGLTMLRLAWLGLGLGALIQINAAYILAPPFIAWLALRGRPIRKAIMPGLVVALAFCAAVAPWTVRNYRTFDRFILVRAGAPFELWYGNLPSKNGWYDDDNWQQHPAHDAYERGLILELGETGYFELCQSRFREQLQSDPMGFVRRTTWRTVYLFLGNPTSRAYWPLLRDRLWHGIVISSTAFNGVVLAMALAGTAIAWRRNLRMCWIIPLGILCVVPFTVTGSYDRHLLPLRAMLVLSSGFALACGVAAARAVVLGKSRGRCIRSEAASASATPPPRIEGDQKGVEAAL